MNLEGLYKVCISNIICEMHVPRFDIPKRKNNYPEESPPVCLFHRDHDYLELSIKYEKNIVSKRKKDDQPIVSKRKKEDQPIVSESELDDQPIVPESELDDQPIVPESELDDQPIVSESKLDDQPMTIDPPVNVIRSQFVNVIRSQFVIKTPKFPYVHDPVSFDLAGIEEIDEYGNPVDVRQPLLPLASCCLIHPFCEGDQEPTTQEEGDPELTTQGEGDPEPTTQEGNPEPTTQTLQPKQPANPNSSGQVLVCVENQEQFLSGVHRVPCSTDYAMADANSNSENSENVHDKKLCKKLYKELLAKKKGQYSVPLICVICHSSFPTRNSLLQHYLTMAGLKIKCHLCDDLLTRRSSLKYHLSIHADYKRFTCTVEGCSKSFRHPHHFKNHIKDHEGPHSCSFCTSVFRSIVTYKRHLKVKHGKVFTKEDTIQDIPNFRSTN